jgi:putative transposase
MTDYRRLRVPGCTYFFTVALQDRSSRLLVDEVALLRNSVRQARNRQFFHIDAWVVLPEHMHCLWTLPPGDADYSQRWRAIKAFFSRSSTAAPPVSASMRKRQERGIWQRRFWEHTIRDADDYEAHMDYIHFNPVKHGLAAHAAGWPLSSFHRCAAHGLYPADWTAQIDDAFEAGEP